MGGLIVACPFWTPNGHSKQHSVMYTETWVERLYRGFARNLTRPFRFVCFTDRERVFSEPIEQERLTNPAPGYADCLEPYRLGAPMILVGLDTVVTGNVDALADYCLTADRIALPLDPFMPSRVCNGVALLPAGHEWIWHDFDGEGGDEADMVWLRKQPHAIIDELFPGQVRSYKCHVKGGGLGDTRLCYFHGREKPHEINEPWLREHWV